MKPYHIKSLAAWALALACGTAIGYAQAWHSTESFVLAQDSVQLKTPEILLARLDAAVSLTAAQKSKATKIFAQQSADLQALLAEDNSTTAKELDQMLKAVKIRTAARAQVRAMLTAEQQNKYNRTPQTQGGGQTMNADNRVARLDADVSLTAEQKPIAHAIYEEEAEALLAFAPEERPAKGRQARQSRIELIDALLTPEQRAKQASLQHIGSAQVAEEKAFVEREVRSSKAIATLVGTITNLSSSRSVINELKGKFRNGSYAFSVTGTNRSETVVVYWQRTLPAAELKVVKIEDSNGRTIQPSSTQSL